MPVPRNQIYGRPPLPEKKGVDIDVSNAAIPFTTGTNDGILALNLIQQGSGSWNRIGRKTHLKSLRIKGQVTFAATRGAASTVLTLPSWRAVVVWDTQPSGNALPTFDSIFGITTQSGAESCPDITCPPRS